MANNDNSISRSAPISIPAGHRGRARSGSISSSSSSTNSSGSELPTPASTSIGSQRISIPSPSVSPILSYFLAQSPTTKTPATASFPFKRKFGTAPVFEEEEQEPEIPVAAHARRASTTVASRFAQNPAAATPYSEATSGRGANVLRRLSLSSGGFVKPQIDTAARNDPRTPPSPPPNTAVTPTAHTAPFATKPRRSATLSGEAARPRRAPSPMGERILTGHFDGFN